MSKDADFVMNTLGFTPGHSLFNPIYPHIWYLQLDISFEPSGFTKRRMLLLHAISALPSNVISLVFDIVDNASEDICYDIVKRAVSSRLSVSREKHLQQLLSLLHLRHRTLSQLSRHTRSLANGNESND
nr:hypothetical protein HmN_001015000 [Hymenolepis microstoma]